ncbi:hypothetical protein ACFC37_03020 [Enterococcus durans]|uniref:hypothetical protein n=1 Tax=Enterococcus durans TaxID=53345 RepID=UPI0039A6A8D0
MVLGVFISVGTSVYASDTFNSIIDEREKYSNVSEEKLSNMLSTLGSIPYSVLESGDAIKANSYLNSFKKIIRNKRGAWECGLAIVGRIVAIVVPVAKLAKIKRFIKASCGIVQAAKIIFGPR